MGLISRLAAKASLKNIEYDITNMAQAFRRQDHLGASRKVYKLAQNIHYAKENGASEADIEARCRSASSLFPLEIGSIALGVFGFVSAKDAGNAEQENQFSALVDSVFVEKFGQPVAVFQ